MVFLVLAALYESLTLPLAVILVVPLSMFSALFGVWITRGDNNIFTQIGLMVLVGLSAKKRDIDRRVRPANLRCTVAPLSAPPLKQVVCACAPF